MDTYYLAGEWKWKVSDGTNHNSSNNNNNNNVKVSTNCVCVVAWWCGCLHHLTIYRMLLPISVWLCGTQENVPYIFIGHVRNVPNIKLLCITKTVGCWWCGAIRVYISSAICGETYGLYTFDRTECSTKSRWKISFLLVCSFARLRTHWFRLSWSIDVFSGIIRYEIYYTATTSIHRMPPPSTSFATTTRKHKKQQQQPYRIVASGTVKLFWTFLFRTFFSFCNFHSIDFTLLGGRIHFTSDKIDFQQNVSNVFVCHDMACNVDHTHTHNRRQWRSACFPPYHLWLMFYSSDLGILENFDASMNALVL